MLGKCGNGNVINKCNHGFAPWGKWYGPLSGCWCHCCKVVPLSGGKKVFDGCGPWKKLTGKGGRWQNRYIVSFCKCDLYTPLSWTTVINTYWTNEIKSAEFIAMHTPLYQLKYMTNVSKCCDCADYCRLTEFGPGLTEFGPPMWQAEADNELILFASPATAVGQILLTMAKFC